MRAAAIAILAAGKGTRIAIRIAERFFILLAMRLCCNHAHARGAEPRAGANSRLSPGHGAAAG